MDPRQQQEGVKTVPAEFSDLRHVRGVLSMGRYVTIFKYSLLTVQQSIVVFPPKTVPESP
eukprot:1007238-Pyramimonas_sp.AAC.1